MGKISNLFYSIMISASIGTTGCQRSNFIEVQMPNCPRQEYPVEVNRLENYVYTTYLQQLEISDIDGAIESLEDLYQIYLQDMESYRENGGEFIRNQIRLVRGITDNPEQLNLLERIRQRNAVSMGWEDYEVELFE